MSTPNELTNVANSPIEPIVAQPAEPTKSVEELIANAEHLTNNQKILVKTYYELLKNNIANSIESFKNQDGTQILFYTLLVTQIVKQVEQSKLAGADKKAVAVEVGHLILHEATVGKPNAAELLMLYDTFASSFIDQLVDAAKNVNVTVRSAETNKAPGGCCVIQ